MERTSATSTICINWTSNEESKHNMTAKCERVTTCIFFYVLLSDTCLFLPEKSIFFQLRIDVNEPHFISYISHLTSLCCRLLRLQLCD